MRYYTRHAILRLVQRLIAGNSQNWNCFYSVAVSPYLKNYFKSNRGFAPSRKYEIGINVSSFDLTVNDGKSFS
jgi:hypothetical protein